MKSWNNSDELAESYLNDLKPLKALYSYFKDRRDICLKLEVECQEQGEWTLAGEFKQDYKDYRERMKKISAIISSSEYSIKWLQVGKEPIVNVNVSRLSYDQRTILVSDVDEVLMYLNTLQTDYPKMNEQQLERLYKIIDGLTPRERDAFISIKGQRNTYRKTAEFMEISESSVRSYVKRAEYKIQKHLEKKCLN